MIIPGLFDINKLNCWLPQVFCQGSQQGRARQEDHPFRANHHCLPVLCTSTVVSDTAPELLTEDDTCPDHPLRSLALYPVRCLVWSPDRSIISVAHSGLP